VCPSFTFAPGIARQSARVATAVHAFAVPVWQQNGGLAVGVRLLPHLFLMSVIFFVSMLASASATFGFVITSRHCARVCPSRPHDSRVFSRFRTYLNPAFAIARWQVSSPVLPRFA